LGHTVAVAGFTAAFLAAVTAVQAAQAPAAPARVVSQPTVVEMFTSKYCPNCPAAEVKMKKLAAEDPNLLILFEHVDYWDDDTRKDPFGLADITQRQYDYSNTVGRRPGEVFTPMPLLNGKVVASPPLWLNWEGALREARQAPIPYTLTLTRAADGGVSMTLPAAAMAKLGKKVPEVWIMGLSPVEHTPVWRVRGIAKATLNGTTAHVPAALMPKVDGKPLSRLVALMQEPGPGAVVAVGQAKQ
jgi:hypothetical protein